jgi:hypothetical protein
MLALIALVAAIAAVDSLNPTTVAPALYLATTPNARRSVAAFTLGVFAVSTAAGLLLLLGPGQLLVHLVPHPGSDVKHKLEIVVGVVALVAAVVLWVLRDKLSGHIHAQAQKVERSSLLLGAGIMLVELPTAIPYFAVIAAIAEAELSPLKDVGLILLFNVIFVAPLLAILGVRLLASERAVEKLERLRLGLHRHIGVVLPLLVGLVGLVLVGMGIAGLAQG